MPKIASIIALALLIGGCADPTLNESNPTPPITASVEDLLTNYEIKPLSDDGTIWTARIKRGLNIYVHKTESDRINLDLSMDGGRWADWIDADDKNGLLALYLHLVETDLDAKVDPLSAKIEFILTEEELRITGNCPPENLSETLALIQDGLITPDVSETHFNAAKAASLAAIHTRETSLERIASLALKRLIYGPNIPYGKPHNGMREIVETLTVQDIKSAIAAHDGAETRIHISGNISREEALRAVSRFGEHFERKFLQYWGFGIIDQDKGGHVYLIDVPGAEQSVVSAGKLTIGAKHKDFGALTTITQINDGRTPQMFSRSHTVAPGQTGQSLIDLKAEIAALSSQRPDQINDQDLSPIETLRRMSKYGLSYLEPAGEFTAKELQIVADTHLNVNDMVYLVVGDKSKIFEASNDFAKGQLIEIDIYGEPIN